MERNARGRRTALFTKRPEPGHVKTRLCPPLAPEEAAHLAAAMLRDTLEKCLAGDFETTLVFAPESAAAWFRSEFPRPAQQVAQRGEGLGARLAHFVRTAFEEGATTSLVVIGSDQPLVPLARLEEAHARLAAGADLVLGPDRGGGYYLVGLRAPRDELFTAVTMSSAGMCAATAAFARARGLAVARLAEDDDIDTPADLARLSTHLAHSNPEFTRHTRAALAALSQRITSLQP